VGTVVVSAPPVTVTALDERIVPAVVFHHSNVLLPFAKACRAQPLPEKVPVSNRGYLIA